MRRYVSVDVQRGSSVGMGQPRACDGPRAGREGGLLLLLLGGKRRLEIGKEFVWRINHCRGQRGKLQMNERERDNERQIRIHTHTTRGTRGTYIVCLEMDERLLIIWKNVLAGVVSTISTWTQYVAHFPKNLFRPNSSGKLDINVYYAIKYCILVQL